MYKRQGETYAAYHALQAEAGAAEMEGLYEKAAQKYEECLQYQDNLENRMKMTENYAALALESGTYTRIQKVEECLEAVSYTHLVFLCLSFIREGIAWIGNLIQGPGSLIRQTDLALKSFDE